MALSVPEIARALASSGNGGVSDADLDAHLSIENRRVSDRFWTPVTVAAAAARWLTDAGARRVLDVGSGVGKFCVVAALASNDLQLTGIEQRAGLVAASHALARRFGVEHRVQFVAGTIDDIALTEFDALYFFNPFGESLYARAQQLDGSVDLSGSRRRRDVAVIERALEEAAIGHVVATYHGFGGQVPDTFDLLREEPMGSDMLRLWIRRRRVSRGHRWVDVGAKLHLCTDTVAQKWRDVSLLVIEDGPDQTK